MTAQRNQAQAPGLQAPAGGPLPGVSQGLGEVSEELHPILQWIVDRFKIITAVLVGVLIIGIIIFIYDLNKDNAYHANREELGKILISSSGQERIDALDAFLAGSPGEFALQARLELISALQEQGLNERVLAEWNKVAEDDRDLVVMVAMGKANALHSLGRDAEALDALLEARQRVGETLVLPLARAIAAQAEITGNLEEAISAYQDLLGANLEGDSGFYKDKIAKLNERLGRDG